jgi:hypothetical protein
MVYSPKHCRFVERCTPRTFKQLLACATQHHQTLTAERIAELAEIPLKWLYDYANENEPRHLPAAKLARIVEVTGRVDLFRFLLAPLGFAVVTVQDASTADQVNEQVLKIAEDTGSLSREWRESSRDGHVDETEQERLVRHIDSQQTHLSELRSSVVGLGSSTRASLHAMAGGR